MLAALAVIALLAILAVLAAVLGHAPLVAGAAVAPLWPYSSQIAADIQRSWRDACARLLAELEVPPPVVRCGVVM